MAETITIEQAKHDIALVQALGEQKDVLLTEKDHELHLQKEDFQTQLAIEVNNAREEGNQSGLKEAREEGEKVHPWLILHSPSAPFGPFISRIRFC